MSALIDSPEFFWFALAVAAVFTVFATGVGGYVALRARSALQARGIVQ